MKAEKCPTISGSSLVGKRAKKIILEFPLWKAYVKIVTLNAKTMYKSSNTLSGSTSATELPEVRFKIFKWHSVRNKETYNSDCVVLSKPTFHQNISTTPRSQDS